jgi:hypothetical protein
VGWKGRDVALNPPVLNFFCSAQASFPDAPVAAP